jgi:hypothetical protein
MANGIAKVSMETCKLVGDPVRTVRLVSRLLDVCVHGHEHEGSIAVNNMTMKDVPGQ